tara:strand:- start:235 stop:1527 length:1293 start_codon:yes stop_codon:yes gene_type:complete
MTEIFQILFSYLIFSFTIFLPFNILIKDKRFKKFNSNDICSFNLAININILLLLSLLDISLITIQKYLIILYLILFIIVYHKNLKKFFINQIQFLPVLVIFFIISISVANNLKLGWDAKFFYYIKSLYFYEGNTIASLKEFDAHHYHPHLGSYLWAFFRNLSFIEYEYFGRLFYVFIFTFSIFYIVPKNDNKFLPFFYLLITLSIFYNYELFSGLHEIMIFSYLMIISKYLYNMIVARNFFYLVFIIFYINLIFWTKTEGLVYAFIFLILINLIKKIEIREKIISSIIILSLILLKTLIYQYYEINLNAQPLYNYDYIITLNLSLIIEKIRYIIPWLAYYSLSNIFFVTGLILILYQNFNKEIKNEHIKLLNVYLFLFMSFIFSAYILREQDIIYSIRTTMDRLVMTSSGFFLFMIYQNINKIIQKKKIF